MPNITKEAFSVLMVSLTTASGIILKHWKTIKCCELTNWIRAIEETTSYELNKLKCNTVGGSDYCHL